MMDEDEDEDGLREPPRPVPVAEAAFQLCRVYDRDPPTAGDLRRWSNMIRVWTDRYKDAHAYGPVRRRRYLLPELLPYAEHWRARHGGRGPRPRS